MRIGIRQGLGSSSGESAFSGHRLALGIVVLSLSLVACGGDESPRAPEAEQPEPDAVPEAAETAPEPPEPEPEIEPAPEPEPEPLPRKLEYRVAEPGETLWDVVSNELAADLERDLSDAQIERLINRGVCGAKSDGGEIRHFFQLDGTPVPGAEPPSDRSPHRLRQGIDTIVCDRVRAEEILSGP